MMTVWPWWSEILETLEWYCILLFTEEDDDEEEDPGEAALDGAVMQDLDNVALPTGSRGRAKLLYFCDNRRPAYWGTWSKKSVAVSGRRPFAKDVSTILYMCVCLRGNYNMSVMGIG